MKSRDARLLAAFVSAGVGGGIARAYPGTDIGKAGKIAGGAGTSVLIWSWWTGK